MEEFSLAALARMIAQRVETGHPEAQASPVRTGRATRRQCGAAGCCDPSSHSATPPWLEHAPLWCLL